MDLRDTISSVEQPDAFLQFLERSKLDIPSLAAKVDAENGGLFSSNHTKIIGEYRTWELGAKIAQEEPPASFSIFGDVNRVFYLINVSKEKHFAFFGAATYGSYEGVTERDVQQVNYLIRSHEKLLNAPRDLKENEWFVVTCKDPSDRWPAEGKVVVPRAVP